MRRSGGDGCGAAMDDVAVQAAMEDGAADVDGDKGGRGDGTGHGNDAISLMRLRR